MNVSLPTLFVSHGSPMHAIQAGRAGDAWTALGQRLARPKAVLVASAHWETELPMVGTSGQPETIHDFGGFPQELYRIRYAAPGAPDVAARAVELLKSAGLAATPNGCRGLDHGAWVPLLRLFPEADVPVAPISIQPSLDAGHHLRVGEALAPLAAEGVLVLGSGHMTHNLREWIADARRRGSMSIDEREPEPYIREFTTWVDDALRRDDRTALARWAESAPHARRAHPTPEHFLPLMVAVGAAGPTPMVEHIDAGVDSGVLAMDAYLFWPRPQG
ncbi:MAG: dioxygenase [Burkholderiaceae bacterium]|jgi:4,5-DOPA dioxygenase extradiol|nr:dioxygenase [Burkholderiaceae bacterium]MDH5208483.1 dioxygenase [Burkholderiaceae bacterium]